LFCPLSCFCNLFNNTCEKAVHTIFTKGSSILNYILALNSCQEKSALKFKFMATKSQHNMTYRVLPALLKQMRLKAGLTQRAIGQKLSKPHSYVYSCETANRRVDITEFIAWSKACGVNPKTALSELLKLLD